MTPSFADRAKRSSRDNAQGAEVLGVKGESTGAPAPLWGATGNAAAEDKRCSKG